MSLGNKLNSACLRNQRSCSLLILVCVLKSDHKFLLGSISVGLTDKVCLMYCSRHLWKIWQAEEEALNGLVLDSLLLELKQSHF